MSLKFQENVYNPAMRITIEIPLIHLVVGFIPARSCIGAGLAGADKPRPYEKLISSKNEEIFTF
jgi:hypothetical protein